MAANSSSSSYSLPTLPNPSTTFTVKLTPNNYLPRCCIWSRHSVASPILQIPTLRLKAID
ncbi:hypothetical protein LINPERPRIM_LOCUS26306 [Linum perenne]